jgi:hypothetical protein
LRQENSVSKAEASINIYYIQKFWFGEAYYTDTSYHKHYFTVELPKVNVDAQIWLTIFSPGVSFDAGVTGLAAAGLKSYQFIDSNGTQQYREFDHWESHLRIEQCVEITFAFHVQLAWAKAEGIIYWHS